MSPPPDKRITVKIWCDDGDYWTTDFNGTTAEAFRYFWGTRFEKSDEVSHHTVVAIEYLEL